jgi:hypothetical protein
MLHIFGRITIDAHAGRRTGGGTLTFPQCRITYSLINCFLGGLLVSLSGASFLERALP